MKGMRDRSSGTQGCTVACSAYTKPNYVIPWIYEGLEWYARIHPLGCRIAVYKRPLNCKQLKRDEFVMGDISDKLFNLGMQLPGEQQGGILLLRVHKSH
jgi:hypothetical protein